MPSVTKAVVLTTESCLSPDAVAGTKTLPGIAASPVLDVMTGAMVEFSLLALKGSDWTTRTGRRLAGLLPCGSPRSAQQILPRRITSRPGWLGAALRLACSKVSSRILGIADLAGVMSRQFGGSTAHQAPEPVPALAALFSRPPSSVLAKMANLDGSRSHGAKFDVLAGAMLREDLDLFGYVYRTLLRAARAEGIGPDRLPDFLGLETGQDLTLLGQDELDVSVLEADLRDKIARHAAGEGLSELQTERILVAAARVGQHVFALSVLRNCGSRCVFCGFSPAAFGAKKMLLAGHIKPWKDSTPGERLDPCNGLAACPPHDVAFDTGLLMVNGGLRIHVARSLADAVRADQMARQYYGKPPLRDSLLLPDGALTPSARYLDWHRQKIFQT